MNFKSLKPKELRKTARNETETIVKLENSILRKIFHYNTTYKNKNVAKLK